MPCHPDDAIVGVGHDRHLVPLVSAHLSIDQKVLNLLAPAQTERAETIDAVWRAVEALNPDLKMALLLRDIVGLSYTEIAETLEITLATVKWRIYKAREDVQLALAREGIFFGSKQAEEPKAAAAAPVA